MSYAPTARERVTLVAHLDPALDLEKSNLKQYMLTLDESHLVVLEGAELTRYHFAAPSRWEEEWLSGEVLVEENTAMVGRAWVQACLREVTGPHPVTEQEVEDARRPHKGLRLLPLSAPFLSDRKVFPTSAYWFIGKLLPKHLELGADEGN